MTLKQLSADGMLAYLISEACIKANLKGRRLTYRIAALHLVASEGEFICIPFFQEFQRSMYGLCDTVTDVTVNPSKHCCNGMIGRYVSIVINRPEYLTLCEVEVYGDPVTQSYACF